MGADSTAPSAPPGREIRCNTPPMPGDHAWSRMSMSMPAGVLRAMGKLNVPVYHLTRGRVMGRIGRAPVLLLTSTGRR
jgi:hypothetical protein